MQPIASLDIPPKLPDPKDYVRNYPFRSPLVIAEAAKPIIEGKTVCDVGCGEGDLLRQFNKYAKTTVGMEIDPQRYRKARCVDIVVGDWRKDPIPDADVYYTWAGQPFDNIRVARKCLEKPHFVIVMIGGRQGAEHVNRAVDTWGGYILEFPFLEHSELPDWRPMGIWWLGIINN